MCGEILRRSGLYSSDDGASCGGQDVFVNLRKQQFTRWGISYIIDKHVGLASLSVHLLQSGVSLIFLRDFHGHSDCSSTQIYAKADNETWTKALEAPYVDILPTSELPDWSDDKNLMEFLISLGR